MATQFSLYGQTPSAASVQQLPWANYFSDQNNLNERNRVAAIIASLQLQEQQDRQDEYARRFDQGRVIDLANYNRDLSERRRVESENMRRFNIGLSSDREKLSEDKRRFGITSELSRARLPQYEPDETEAERRDAQLNFLKSATARTIAKNLADLVNVRRSTVKDYLATPADERASGSLTPFQRNLIVQSLAAQMGKPDPAIRWDDDIMTWTAEPAMSRGFNPVIGNLRAMENTPRAPAFIPPAPSLSTSRPYPPSFYIRVNQLIDSGMDPRAAKAKAISELSR